MMLGSGAVYIYAIAFAAFFPYYNDRWGACAHTALPHPISCCTLTLKHT